MPSFHPIKAWDTYLKIISLIISVPDDEDTVSETEYIFHTEVSED